MQSGTTATTAFRHGDELIVANVGDSRAYHFRDGVLTRVSVDHSYVQ